MFSSLKKSRSALVSTIGAVIALVALILFAVQSADGENDPICSVAYCTMIVGILLQCVSIILQSKGKADALVLSCIGLVQTALYAVSLGVFIVGRISWLFLLLSKMEAAPLTALFPTTIVAFVLAILVHVVSSYLPYET